MQTYFVRFLSPKESGYGTIVHVCSSDFTPKTDEETVEMLYRRAFPEVFRKSGFYTIHNTVGQLTKQYIRGLIERHHYSATAEKWKEYNQAWHESNIDKVMYFETGEDFDFFYDP